MESKDLTNLPVEVRLSHFKNLVALSGADRTLAESERAVLGFVAKKWGMSQREVDTVYSTPDKVEAVVTDDRSVCFHQLYDVVEMAIIDSQLKPVERSFCEGLAGQLGFETGAVDAVIQGILSGNQQGLNEAVIQQKLMLDLGIA